MNITSIQLKNFRCFKNKQYTFEGKPATVIVGANGSGKTSVLEALYFACYLRSFRSSNTEDMIQLDTTTCFIKVNTQDELGTHSIKIGFSAEERTIQVNETKIKSYKDLIARYRVIIIMENDLLLIQGAPEIRRSFLDQALLVQDPAQASAFRMYKQVLKQRNALFTHTTKVFNYEEYSLWTEKLWTLTHAIQTQRQEYLKKLEAHVNTLAKEFQEIPFSISLVYKMKNISENYVQWMSSYQHKEQSAQRSLFGAHLDDFEVLFHNKASRQFASRGQQKLIAVLMRIAQCTMMHNETIMLLDDFMTDFDDANAQALIELLMKRSVQTIFTMPSTTSSLLRYLQPYGCQIMDINSSETLPESTFRA